MLNVHKTGENAVVELLDYQIPTTLLSCSAREKLPNSYR